MNKVISHLSSFSLLVSSFIFCLSSFSYAVVLDEFTSTASITTSADTGAGVTLASVAGASGRAAAINYSLGTGNWVILSKDYNAQDFSTEGGNAIRFRYKASGNSNTLEVKFTDGDSTDSAKSDKLDLKFLTVPDDQWRTATVVFSSFSLFPDGTKSFDLTKVSRMAMGVTAENSARGSGIVSLDKIELLKTTYTLIDDFDDGADPDFFGGNSNFIGSSGSRQYFLDGTNKVMKFTFTAPVGENAFLTIGLGNRNFQGYTHLSFKIRGSFGGEAAKAKLESPPGSTELLISTYLIGGITTSYQTVNIPVGDFTNVNFSSITLFTLWSGRDLGVSSATLFIDDLAFVRLGETPQTLRVLDEMDTDVPLSNWDIFTHPDASLNVTVPADITAPDATASNRVYRLNYNFTTSPSLPAETPYAVIERPLQISIAPYRTLRFRYNGTGSSNNIEFKLKDNDNTVWYKKLLLASNTGGSWKMATIPVNQLTFFSAGTDNTLDLRKIKTLEIAVSKGSGGSGTFAIDTLEASDSDVFDVLPQDRLISTFRIVNNPFSPNGDNIKDEVFFVYTLGSASKINFRIYNLEGDEIKTLAVQDQSSGEHALSWNGLDNSGVKVNNGLYIFRLEAEGSDNRKDEIKQLVAVLR